MDCPLCDGEGCGECDGGKFAITGCPRAMVTADVWDLCRYADLYERGIPPVAGGALDQCRAFTDGCMVVWSEQNRWEAESLDRLKRTRKT